MQNFEYYTVITENEDEHLHFVDLELDKNLPFTDYPYSLLVKIKFQKEELFLLEHGKPAIFTVLEKFLAKKTLLLVGSILSKEQIKIFFYAKNENKPLEKELLEKIKAYAKNAKITTHFQKDENYQLYFDELSPGIINYQEIINLRKYASLQKAGDDENLPRKITHYLLFQNAKEIETFLEAIQGENFSVEDKGLWQSAKDLETGEFPYHLQISRVDKTTLLDISLTNLPLVALVTQHHGIYHDFKTTIIKKTP